MEIALRLCEVGTLNRTKTKAPNYANPVTTREGQKESLFHENLDLWLRFQNDVKEFGDLLLFLHQPVNIFCGLQSQSKPKSFFPFSVTLRLSVDMPLFHSSCLKTFIDHFLHSFIQSLNTRQVFHEDNSCVFFFVFCFQCPLCTHLSVWRRRRMSCALLWRMHCTNCRSSTRRTWLRWSRDSRLSTRASGTRSTSPTRSRLTNARLSCRSRSVLTAFLFILSRYSLICSLKLERIEKSL